MAPAARDRGVPLGVRRDDDRPEGGDRGVDGACQERAATDLGQVLVGDALGAGTHRDDGGDLRIGTHHMTPATTGGDGMGPFS